MKKQIVLLNLILTFIGNGQSPSFINIEDLGAIANSNDYAQQNTEAIKNGCSALLTTIKENVASKRASLKPNNASQAGKTKHANVPDPTKVDRKSVRSVINVKETSTNYERNIQKTESIAGYGKGKLSNPSSTKQAPLKSSDVKKQTSASRPELAMGVEDAIHQKVQTMEASLSTKYDNQNTNQKQMHEKKRMPLVDCPKKEQVQSGPKPKMMETVNTNEIALLIKVRDVSKHQQRRNR